MIKKTVCIILSAISVFAVFVCSVVLLPDNLAENIFDSVTAMGLQLELPEALDEYGNIFLPNESECRSIYGYLDARYAEISAENSESTENTQPQEEIPPNEKKVISLDMSLGQTASAIQLKNESKYNPDIYSLMDKGYPVSYSADGPLVLIIHTHGTECYLPDGAEYYSDSSPTRSTDKDINVVAVGKVFAKALSDKGISVIHDETMFDKDSYSSAYDNSEKAISEYLSLYPSIKYVFDIHRDSFSSADGIRSKAVGYIDNVPYAQIMFVVGTDSLGAVHPNWQKNLTVAAFFQKAMLEKYDCIMRQINIRGASFNAEHAIGSVLIEIGSCGNTVGEAKNSAEILGNVIGDVILAG